MKIDPEYFYRTATIIKLKDFIKENKKLEMIENRKMLFTCFRAACLNPSVQMRENESKCVVAPL